MEGAVCVLVLLVDRHLAQGFVSIAVLVALCAAAGPAWATFPGGNGAIVYKWVGESAYRAGPTASSVRTVDPVSGIVRVLRDCPLRFGTPSYTGYTDCSVAYPRYSPDGQAIAFTTVKTTPDFTGAPWQHDPGLATMASDGAGVQEHRTQLTYSGAAWAPAGDRLLLSRELQAPGYPKPTALFLATLDGTELNQVAPAWSWDADWSTKGQIAYVRDRNADPACRRSCQEIFITRLGGTPRRLTYRGGLGPSWSPHGTKLAFVRSSSSGQAGIYAVRRDGSGLHRLTRRGGDPAWSPDGKWIAFVRYGDLYVIRTNGRGLRRLVDSPYSGLDCPCVGPVDWQALPRR
jgi:dipeptidyl aminopeptidase/acylaminoacyl peptidase